MFSNVIYVMGTRNACDSVIPGRLTISYRGLPVQGECVRPLKKWPRQHVVKTRILFFIIFATFVVLEVALKIQVESLGLPSLSKLIGRKTDIEMTDGSLADLIKHIVDRAGSKGRKILLDDSGQLDMTIQVMLNDEGFVPRDKLAQQKLKDGDNVKIMLLVGGG